MNSRNNGNGKRTLVTAVAVLIVFMGLIMFMLNKTWSIESQVQAHCREVPENYITKQQHFRDMEEIRDSLWRIEDRINRIVEQ
jgi:Tfp pilus assembly protein PilO